MRIHIRCVYYRYADTHMRMRVDTQNTWTSTWKMYLASHVHRSQIVRKPVCRSSLHRDRSTSANSSTQDVNDSAYELKRVHRVHMWRGLFMNKSMTSVNDRGRNSFRRSFRDVHDIHRDSCRPKDRCTYDQHSRGFCGFLESHLQQFVAFETLQKTGPLQIWLVVLLV